MARLQFLILFSLTLVLCISGRRALTRDLETLVRRLEAIEAAVPLLNASRCSHDDGSQLFKAVLPTKNSCPVEFYNHRPTNSCYRFMSDVRSWYEARADCQTQGADLVWFDSMVEYRHVVVKLLSYITETKDYINAGYWTGANDITNDGFFWGDTGSIVSSFFYVKPTVSEPNRNYNYGQTTPSPSSTTQKHCIFMKYVRARMQIVQEVSECDGGRLYICKCKTDRSDQSGCSKPTVSKKLTKMSKNGKTTKTPGADSTKQIPT